MFFLIGGVQPRTVTLEEQARVCPFCSRGRVVIQRVDHYLSLFFIPLFPVKRGIPFLGCRNCGALLDEEGRGTRAHRQGKPGSCPSCGRMVDGDAGFSFCPYCGRPL